MMLSIPYLWPFKWRTSVYTLSSPISQIVISGSLKAPSPAARYRPSLENVRQEKDLWDCEVRNYVCLFSLGEQMQIMLPAGEAISPVTGFTAIEFIFLLLNPITFSIWSYSQVNRDYFTQLGSLPYVVGSFRPCSFLRGTGGTGLNCWWTLAYLDCFLAFMI